jgi:hypothetical protein
MFGLFVGLVLGFMLGWIAFSPSELAKDVRTYWGR